MNTRGNSFSNGANPDSGPWGEQLREIRNQEVTWWKMA